MQNKFSKKKNLNKITELKFLFRFIFVLFLFLNFSRFSKITSLFFSQIVLFWNTFLFKFSFISPFSCCYSHLHHLLHQRMSSNFFFFLSCFSYSLEKKGSTSSLKSSKIELYSSHFSLSLFPKFGTKIGKRLWIFYLYWNRTRYINISTLYFLLLFFLFSFCVIDIVTIVLFDKIIIK